MRIVFNIDNTTFIPGTMIFFDSLDYIICQLGDIYSQYPEQITQQMEPYPLKLYSSQG